MLQVVRFIQDLIGKAGFASSLGMIILIAAFCFVLFTVKKGIRPVKLGMLIFVVLAGLLLIWQIKLSAEKIHILEYALLGWLALRDLGKINKKWFAILLTFLFCILIGATDEIFQAILPYRFFDMRDIVFNGLGAVWGMTLFFLGTPF